ncbi:MAG: VOC family protein [Betaproteobacteria bacterium]
MPIQIDHLVVAATSLEQGVQWCEALFGITPALGGEHGLFGTHNRLFKIATPKFSMAYFEIIAINPEAIRPKKTTSLHPHRWFDLDNPELQKSISKEPRLIHFVASTTDIKAARMALRMEGIDRGPAIHAERQTSKGLLHWQISVRADGQRLFDGTLPTLIQWGKPDATEPLRLHPRNTLPRSGVTLQSIDITHPSAEKLQAAYTSIGLNGISISEGPANIKATLKTPKGIVVLE